MLYFVSFQNHPYFFTHVSFLHKDTKKKKKRVVIVQLNDSLGTFRSYSVNKKNAINFAVSSD